MLQASCLRPFLCALAAWQTSPHYDSESGIGFVAWHTCGLMFSIPMFVRIGNRSVFYAVSFYLRGSVKGSRLFLFFIALYTE